MEIAGVHRHVVGDRQLQSAAQQRVGRGRRAHVRAGAGQRVENEIVGDRDAGLAQRLDARPCRRRSRSSPWKSISPPTRTIWKRASTPISRPSPYWTPPDGARLGDAIDAGVKPVPVEIAAGNGDAICRSRPAASSGQPRSHRQSRRRAVTATMALREARMNRSHAFRRKRRRQCPQFRQNRYPWTVASGFLERRFSQAEQSRNSSAFVGSMGRSAGHNVAVPRCGGLATRAPGAASAIDGEVARETGLEPATFGVTGRRSNQLSYSRSSEAEPRATWRSSRGGPWQVKRRRPPIDGPAVAGHGGR